MTRRQVRHGEAHFGARLRFAREAAALTQEQLAQLASVALRTIQRWESGESEPRARQTIALAMALGRDVAWFYTDHDDTPVAA